MDVKSMSAKMSEEQQNEFDGTEETNETEKLPYPSEEKEPTRTDYPSLSKKLEDIIEMTQVINKLVEDISAEQRRKITQIQWSTLEEYKNTQKRNMKPIKFWQNALFTRSYFVDKDLDDCFLNIYKHSTSLNTLLKTLHDSVQGRGEGDSELNNCPEITIESSTSTSSTACNLNSSPDSPYGTRSKTRSGSKSHDDNEKSVIPEASSKIVRQAFSELIRAKIDFDSRFINYHSALTKTSVSEDYNYLYEICTSSTMLGQSLSIESRRLLRTNKRKVNRRKRLSNKVVEQKSHQKPLRKSSRLAPSKDSASDVQIIRTFS